MKYLKLFEDTVPVELDWDDFDFEEEEEDYMTLRDKIKGDKNIIILIEDYVDWVKFIDYNNSEELEIYWAGIFGKPTEKQYSDKIKYISITNRNLTYITHEDGELPPIYHKEKVYPLEDLISDVRKKPSRFSKFKKWLKNESKDIGSFDEDDFDWDEEDTKYYMGRISYDHIEIYRVLLENGEVLRYNDNFKIRNYNDKYSPIKKRVDRGAIFIDRPYLLRHGELIYFYSDKLKKEKMIKILETNILLSTEGGNLRNKLMNIINNQDIFYYGDGGSIINLI